MLKMIDKIIEEMPFMKQVIETKIQKELDVKERELISIKNQQDELTELIGDIMVNNGGEI